MAKQLSLRRLLARKSVASWLETFSAVDAELSLVLVEPDGRIFAQVGQPIGTQVAPLIANLPAEPGPGVISRGRLQLAPLIVGHALVGYIAARAQEKFQTRNWLAVASQGMSLMLKEAYESRGLADEALDRYREISLLYRLGEAIGGLFDPVDILAHILRECQQIIVADFGLALLYEPEIGWQRAGHFGLQTDGIRIDPLLAYAGDVLANHPQPAIVTDLPETGMDDLGAAVGSHLWVPLRASEKLHGGVLLTRYVGQPIFVANDLKLLTALSSQAAVAIETARLHQAELAKQRMEKELQLGHELQASLVPTTAPHLEGWDFSVWWHPAREVSGDFCDFIWLDGDLGVVMADVADKGVQAALFMALTRSTVRASLHTVRQPGASIGEANRLIAQDASRGMFVTLCYAQFRPGGGSVTYVNAGHNPPLWIRQEEGAVVELAPTGTFLGYDAGLPFEEATIDPRPGDIIIFYTDGITEAMNHERALFGEARFQRELLSVAHLSSAGIQEHIQEKIMAYVGDEPQSDDITMVVAVRK